MTPRRRSPGGGALATVRTFGLTAFIGLLLVVPSAFRVDSPNSPAEAALHDRARAVEDLSWIVPTATATGWRATSLDRSRLLMEKARAQQSGDSRKLALANAVLAGESVARARMVLRRWADRLDPETGLLPTSLEQDGNVWGYGNTGADLYPHLVIAAQFTEPELYPRFAGVMAAERARLPGLPRDVDLLTDRPVAQELDERIFGAAEYAKDGLLPLLDRLGPEPWLGRLREIADAVLDASDTPTRSSGAIPADSTEVNGDMVQVLVRLWWVTGDERYIAAAGRIGTTYVEDVLPTTTYLPPNRWDFVENEPLDRRRFRLSDHGNEILSGLIEWHLAETLRGSPSASAHRPAIRRMLERLLDKARNEDGLWLRVIQIPSGKVEQEGVTDAWGYVFQAFLTQAIVEERAPDGEPHLATVYRDAARRAVRALPDYRYYEWERGRMDGFADALESAVYMLHELGEPVAEEWLDDQMPVLYGFQDGDGRVDEQYLDGNFIRTALLYGLRQTRGARLDPWPEGGLLGGTDAQGCLALAAASRDAWDGRLVLDQPRHRLFGNLPVDYARLNKWPEWFVVEPDKAYEVEIAAEGAAPSPLAVTGAELAQGIA
ncbi:MAG: hypothetical protein M3O34_14595, partial [Chloroflexota bacterium]|nr:hypothetical protein [Chloroflexota bacterium]